ncbi:leucine-rich repeat domain-containing protein [Lactococcus allomyrinae]|uniref:Leucine-rich repeat domain-containing protein n=1 Tax=Lactococcus allomyrinae TaxID=2419773 RepID=A0A387BQ93_9LACT|nr:leucine-rich repeat domain-containing protein [Lactococcus allomyrinae]AYG00671.1 leucine-rich repeat domain-containing protein [Lactococcus allomyrinae]
MYKLRYSKVIIITGLLAVSLGPIVSEIPKSLTELSVQAATVTQTYTDSQGITYTLDNTGQTATVTTFSGVVGADVIIPDSVSTDGLSYRVTSIGAYAFSNMGLHSVIIGNNVTDINTSAFQTTTSYPDYYKKALTSVILGSNVQNIKTDAFAGNALTNIIFPSSVSKIATRAFANNLLTEVSFGNNVTEIMSKAFQSNQLTNITFADDARTIVDSEAFSGSPVSSLTLGIGVTLADDTFNKVSPLFGQLDDLPLTGVRTIFVSSDGTIQKSWLEEDMASTGDSISENTDNEGNTKGSNDEETVSTDSPVTLPDDVLLDNETSSSDAPNVNGKTTVSTDSPTTLPNTPGVDDTIILPDDADNASIDSSNVVSEAEIIPSIADNDKLLTTIDSAPKKLSVSSKTLELRSSLPPSESVEKLKKTLMTKRSKGLSPALLSHTVSSELPKQPKTKQTATKESTSIDKKSQNLKQTEKSGQRQQKFDYFMIIPALLLGFIVGKLIPSPKKFKK